jgi:branched-chain amino acid aminotransferase
MNKGYGFVGKSYCALDDAKISVFDPGFTHSDVVYDVTSTWRGQFFRLDDHISRFLRSCAGIKLDCPYSAGQLRCILANCVDRGGVADASFVSVALTRGEYASEKARQTRDIFETNPTLIAYAVPYLWIADQAMQERGLSAIIAKTPRIANASVNMQYKNYHWGDMTQGKFEAREAGADTCVLLSIEGYLTEGPGFNLFFVKDGRLHTPAHNVLAGLTRQSIIDIALDLRIPVQIGDFPAADLMSADEAFLTSTAGGVMPLARIGNRTFASRGPEAMARRLRTEYWSRRERGWLGTSVADAMKQRAIDTP